MNHSVLKNTVRFLHIVGYRVKDIRQNSFLPLYIFSRTASTFGDIAFNIFVVTFVFKSTGSSVQTASVLALAAVPHVLIGKHVSRRIDTWNPRSIAILSDIFRFFVLVIFSFISGVKAFYFIVPLLSLGGVFFNPASVKLIQLAIDHTLLVKANSTISFCENLAKICAPFFVGALFVYFEARQLFLINAFSFMVSAACISFIAPNIYSRNSPDVIKQYELTTALSHHNGIIYYFIFSASIFSFFCGMSSLVLPIYSYKILHIAEQQFALLFTSSGIGLLLGSLIVRVLQRHINMIIGMQFCLFSIGPIWILCFFYQSFWSLLVARLFEGFFISIYLIYLKSGILEYFPQFLTGAVFTRVIIFQSILVPTGLLCAGYFVEAFLPSTIYLVMGCAISLSVAFMQLCLLSYYYKGILPQNFWVGDRTKT